MIEKSSVIAMSDDAGLYGLWVKFEDRYDRGFLQHKDEIQE